MKYVLTDKLSISDSTDSVYILNEETEKDYYFNSSGSIIMKFIINNSSFVVEDLKNHLSKKYGKPPSSFKDCVDKFLTNLLNVDILKQIK